MSICDVYVIINIKRNNYEGENVRKGLATELLLNSVRISITALQQHN